MSNTVTVNGRTFYYKTYHNYDGGHDISRTVFYEREESIFFGLIKFPVELFYIQGSVTNTELTKEWWAEQIQKEVEQLEKTERRLKEIRNGEIV